MSFELRLAKPRVTRRRVDSLPEGLALLLRRGEFVVWAESDGCYAVERRGEYLRRYDSLGDLEKAEGRR